MRKQEFNSKHLPSPARRGSRSRTASPPAPLAIRKAPSGRRRKSRRQSHNFFLAPAAPGTPTRRHALGRLPTPPPLPENLLLGLHRKLPSVPPASTQEGFGIRKSASNSGHSPLRGSGGCSMHC